MRQRGGRWPVAVLAAAGLGLAAVHALGAAARPVAPGAGAARAARAPGRAGPLLAGTPLPTPLILGYYDGGGVDSPAWYDMVAHTGTLNGIVPDWFEIWSQGQITGTADPGVLAYARSHALWTFALVQQNEDPAVFTALLTHPASERDAEANLLALCERDGFDGVNLDFEGIAPAERRAFTGFVRALSDVLHAHGYYVTLSVPAETGNDPTNSWTGAYDYEALGRAADLVMPMAYDDHYAGGPPGAVAPTAWVQSVARYSASAIPPAKVVLALPGYGYDWGGRALAMPLSYGQAADLDDQFARGRAGSHFDYTADGVVHEVYYDDAQSFAAQSQIVEDYDLRGVVIWSLGIEDPGIWSLIAP